MPQKMPASDIFFNASNRFDEGHTPGSTILLSLSLQAVMVIFTIVGECLLILKTNNFLKDYTGLTSPLY